MRLADEQGRLNGFDVRLKGIVPHDPANPAPRCLDAVPETPASARAPVASIAPSAVPSGSATSRLVANTPGADAVVAKNKWRFRVCYNTALRHDPDAGGTATVKVSIDAQGKVTAATASERGICPVWLGACVANTFYSMKFPVPDGGQATFTVNAVFAAKK